MPDLFFNNRIQLAAGMCIPEFQSQKYTQKPPFWVVTIIFWDSYTNPGFLHIMDTHIPRKSM